jgi:hypothetical protein
MSKRGTYLLQTYAVEDIIQDKNPLRNSSEDITNHHKLMWVEFLRNAFMKRG